MKNISILLITTAIILTVILMITGKMDFTSFLSTRLDISGSFQALLKTIIIGFVWGVGLAIMIVITLVDVIITITTRIEFPILNFLYQWIFISFSQTWYWDQFTGMQLFSSALFLFFIGVALLLIPELRKKQIVRYHYSKSKD